MDKLQEGKSFTFREEDDKIVLYVEAVFGTGRVGWAQVAIVHDSVEAVLVIQQSEGRNPNIPLEKIKELIERYDALQAEKTNGHTD